MKKRWGLFGLIGVLVVLGIARLTAREVDPAIAPDAPQAGLPGRIPGQDQGSPMTRKTPPALVEVPLIKPTFEAGVVLKALAVDAPRGAPGPVDKRDNAGPNAARELEILRYGFETLEEDVQDCLKEWDSPPANVMIAFEIDANGLQRSWLEHDVEIPFGPRTCLSNAVYGLDWSKIVDQPAKLTQRFELGRKDAG